jgi:hypothetical protein
MDYSRERGAPSNVRGWLSEVYLPAIVAAQHEQLMRRLGDRSTVDDPIFGRSAGSPAVERHLEQASAWFAKRSATYERLAFTTGSDRDVTEGTIALTIDGRNVRVPVAVVAERRPDREVEIRLYHSTKSIETASRTRSPLVPRDDELTVPPPVAAHLKSLARGDLGAIVATFEDGATVRDADGQTHTRDGQGGTLRAYYEKLLGARVPGGPGIDVLKGARADDGRTCALEYTVAHMHGKDIAPQPGLAVYERGESGLLRAVRLYQDW